jgi:hypothetical protein
VDHPKLFRPSKEERCERTPRTKHQARRRAQGASLLVNYQKLRVGVAVCPRVQSSERVMRGGSGSSRAIHWLLYVRVQSELGLSQTATAIAITCQHGRKIRRIPPSITLQGTTLADCVQRKRLMRRSFDDCCALLHAHFRPHTVGTAQLRVRDACMHR